VGPRGEVGGDAWRKIVGNSGGGFIAESVQLRSISQSRATPRERVWESTDSKKESKHRSLSLGRNHMEKKLRENGIILA